MTKTAKMGWAGRVYSSMTWGGGIAWGRGSSGWGEDWGSSSKLMRRGEQDPEGIIPDGGAGGG